MNGAIIFNRTQGTDIADALVRARGGAAGIWRARAEYFGAAMPSVFG